MSTSLRLIRDLAEREGFETKGLAPTSAATKALREAASNWGEEKIGVVDLRKMEVIKRLPTASKPNGSTYAAPFRKVYVADTLGKALAIVDVDKDEIVKTLHFD